jgi:GPH family glycoside/pentoside/hexuronide:cation symporter
MALTPELATTYDERTHLSTYRIGFSTFASLVAVAVPPILVSLVSGSQDLISSRPVAWLVMGLVFAVITSLSYLVMTMLVKEPRRSAQVLEPSPFISEYRSAFTIYGFSAIFVLFVVITIGIMVLNSILPFFLESALHFGANEQTLILGLLFGVAILAFPLWNVLASRLGKRGSLMLGLLLLALAVLLLVAFSAPGQLSFVLLSMIVIAGFGLSAVMLFPWAMLPDVVEFDENKTGKRREGLVYALFTFGQKMAGSIGVFANAIVTSVFAYQQGVLEQAPETVRAITFMAGPVAALIFLGAIGLTWRFPITRAKHEAVKKHLSV